MVAARAPTCRKGAVPCTWRGGHPVVSMCRPLGVPAPSLALTGTEPHGRTHLQGDEQHLPLVLPQLRHSGHGHHCASQDDHQPYLGGGRGTRQRVRTGGRVSSVMGEVRGNGMCWQREGPKTVGMVGGWEKKAQLRREQTVKEVGRCRPLHGPVRASQPPCRQNPVLW